MSNYYIKRERKLKRRLRFFLKSLKKPLIDYYGEDFNSKVYHETEDEFDSVIRALPDIGGKKNHFTIIITINGFILAFYRVMKRNGRTIEDVIRIICEGTERRFKSIPRLITWIIGRIAFSPIFYRSMKKNAERSQKREYSANFVYTVEKGTKESYDMKSIYTECAVCKFHTAENAEEILTYCDFADVLMSKYFGLGLEYESRIGGGDTTCTGTFMRGREVKIPAHLKEFID